MEDVKDNTTIPYLINAIENLDRVVKGLDKAKAQERAGYLRKGISLADHIAKSLKLMK